MIEDYEYNILINPANLFDNSREIEDFVILSDSIEEQEAFFTGIDKRGFI